MQTKPIAITQAKTHIKKPQKRPHETYFTGSPGKSAEIAGRTSPLIVDPSRAIQSVIPKANESSLPLNHYDTIAL